MSDKPTAQERLQIAFESDDLTLADGRVGDADYLVALGLTPSIVERELGRAAGKAAGLVQRVHRSTNPGDIRDAHKAVVALAHRLALKRGWKIAPPQIKRVAEVALGHHINPTCKHCEGRRFELVPGTPVLSAKVCKPCNGTGERQIQRRWNREVRDVLEMLERIDVVTGQAVARMMR